MGDKANTACLVEQAIEIAPSLPDDLAGEMLRAVCFLEERGAYFCFDLVDGFEPIEPPDLPLDLRTVLVGCFAKDQSIIWEIAASKHRSGLIVAWHWDGDGTLLFATDDWLLSNSDCKKSYGWTRDDMDWVSEVINSPSYYDTDDATPTTTQRSA